MKINANQYSESYANSRHPYSFPRITSMIGDGKTKYDLGGDGEANSAGACSVCSCFHLNDFQMMTIIPGELQKI